MAKRKKTGTSVPGLGFLTSEGDLIAPLGTDGAALIVLKKFAPAKCCDGRMVAMIINRDGKTRCTVCDGKYQDQESARAQTRG